MKTDSIFSTSDSYKYAHSSLLRKDILSQYNYIESRGGPTDTISWNGMQGLIKRYLMKVPTEAEVARTELLAKLHGVPFDRPMWDRILELGYYPVEIRSIREGTEVPTNHVLATFESTDDKCVGLVGFLETLFMKVWLPTTVATKAMNVKRTLLKYGCPEWAQFAYHNFGARSCTSEEQSQVAGFAHLIHFLGTDNFGSLFYAEDYYNQPIDIAAGYSVLATEHSVTTMNLEVNEEKFIYEAILANPYAAILSFVADSYDVYKFVRFCTDPTSRIRLLIESRPHQKLVIRPDSGDPFEVLIKILDIMNISGIKKIDINGKKAFAQYGVLWGDGITPETIDNLLDYFVTDCGWAAENFVFGSGTDLVNNHSRDTYKFAIKCSSITVRQNKLPDTGPWGAVEEIDVYKDPITDPGKVSKKGRVTTWYDTEEKVFIKGLRNRQPNVHCVDLLETIYRDGKLLVDLSLEDLRNALV